MATRHSLWLVERRGGSGSGLSDAQIERLSTDANRLVRVHLVKALAERADWKGSKSDVAALLRGKLADNDPFVRRAAADALGRHPSFESIEPLLKLWANTPAEDSHLVHVTRMALRDHLATPGIYKQVQPLADASPIDAARLADLSLGVHNSDSAEYMLRFLSKHQVADAQLGDYVHHVARYIAPQRVGEVHAYAAAHRRTPRPASAP